MYGFRVSLQAGQFVDRRKFPTGGRNMPNSNSFGATVALKALFDRIRTASKAVSLPSPQVIAVKTG